jgi:hypothetical protein
MTLKNWSWGRTVHLAQMRPAKFSFGHQYSLATFQPICLIIPLQDNTSAESLQNTMVVVPRGTPGVDGEQMRYLKKLAMNHIKRSIHHRAKTRSGKMAKPSYGMVWAQCFLLVSHRTSWSWFERIRHFRKKK